MCSWNSDLITLSSSFDKQKLHYKKVYIHMYIEKNISCCSLNFKTQNIKYVVWIYDCFIVRNISTTSVQINKLLTK